MGFACEQTKSTTLQIGARVKVKVPLKVYHVPKIAEVDFTGMEGEIKQYVGLCKGKRISTNLPYKVKAFLAVVSGMAALVLLRLIVHDHDNLFVAAEAVHSLGISILIYKLIKEKTCVGLSLKSQELTAMFLAARLYCSFVMEYDIHTLLDLATLATTLWVIYMIRFKLKSSYMEEKDNFARYYVVIPCAVLALFIHPSASHHLLNRIFWAFCVYLEAVSVLPQLRVMQNTKIVEPFTAHYVFALGVARFLSCAHWVLQMRKWKAWETETKTIEYQFYNDPERFRFARDTTFGRGHLNSWSQSTISLAIVSFFRQFFGSVNKVDYLTLRHGFITTMMKELEDLYNESQSNGCIEHALGIMEEKKTQENLFEKISNISLIGTEQLEKFLLDKLDVYESAMGDSYVKCTPRIAGFAPAFQAISRNPIVLDLAYNMIEFPPIENRMKKDRKVKGSFINRIFG
ncbi:hypothetical protein Fmac_001433 [Flemingia macrophylla]|uniref:Ferredoxin thioredoxin reductase alpha chain domain-containing protein n=1 Tax=Flemingia macrophylla TaxID=520843 RepID=A0ABD1NIR1_9FABA